MCGAKGYHPVYLALPEDESNTYYVNRAHNGMYRTTHIRLSYDQAFALCDVLNEFSHLEVKR